MRTAAERYPVSRAAPGVSAPPVVPKKTPPGAHSRCADATKRSESGLDSTCAASTGTYGTRRAAGALPGFAARARHPALLVHAAHDRVRHSLTAAVAQPGHARRAGHATAQRSAPASRRGAHVQHGAGPEERNAADQARGGGVRPRADERVVGQAAEQRAHAQPLPVHEQVQAKVPARGHRPFKISKFQCHEQVRPLIHIIDCTGPVPRINEKMSRPKRSHTAATTLLRGEGHSCQPTCALQPAPTMSTTSCGSARMQP